MRNIQSKEWNCNNTCKTSCCDKMFLPISKDNIERLNTGRLILLNKEFNDYNWLELHDGITVDRIGSREYYVHFLPDIRLQVKENSYNNEMYLQVDSRCSMLLKNNKCKIFRGRPKTCRIGLCPKESTDKSYRWFWEEANKNGSTN